MRHSIDHPDKEYYIRHYRDEWLYKQIAVGVEKDEVQEQDLFYQYIQPLASILSYCTVSILLTLLNKFILIHDSNMAGLIFSLLTCQSVVCLILLLIMCTLLSSYSSFSSSSLTLDWVKLKHWFPVSLALVCMIYSGSRALLYLSIPVFTIFKNLSIPLVAYLEWYNLISQTPTAHNSNSSRTWMYISFALMFLSSIIAARAEINGNSTGTTTQISHPTSTTFVGNEFISNDDLFGRTSPEEDAFYYDYNSYWSFTLSYPFFGFFWMTVNILSTALYTLLMKRQLHITGFKDLETVFYNNLICIPLLLTLSLIFERHHVSGFVSNVFDWYSGADIISETYGPLLIAILLSCVCTLCISYTTSWCVRVTSSTTYSMVGALNKLPMALAGLLFFSSYGGQMSTMGFIWNALAIAVGFLSGMLYTIAKTRPSILDSLPLMMLSSSLFGEGSGRNLPRWTEPINSSMTTSSASTSPLLKAAHDD